MIKATTARRARESAGFTLIELLVVITLIAILGAVVSVGVNGFITTANQRAHEAQFQAVNKAIKTFVTTSIGASGTLEQASYPVKITALTGTGGLCDSVTLSGTAPAAGAKYNESTNSGWYGADGSTKTITITAASTDSFCYVDLYTTTGSTGLVQNGYIDKGAVKSTAGPGVAAPATDVAILAASDATTGAFFRCIFDSSASAAGTGAAKPSVALNNVRANKGLLLACRDSDPFTP